MMRMALETEIMKKKRQEEKNAKRLAFFLRIVGVGMMFVAGMMFMVMFTVPNAKGAGWIFAAALIGATICYTNGEGGAE